MKLLAQSNNAQKNIILPKIIQNKLLEINDTHLTQQETTDEQTLNIELKQLRKMNLINAINSESLKEEPEDIWYILEPKSN